MAKRPHTCSANTNSTPQSEKPRKGHKGNDDEYEETVNVAPESLSVTIIDPEVMDCPICFEPLSPPVYECENGHVLCGSCCHGMEKCGSCGCLIGSKRCRALERVIDSMRVPCGNAPHGCTESLTFSHKLHHENMCPHSPCFCPYPNCSYMGLHSSVNSHFAANHSASSQRFMFNCEDSVTLETDQRHVFLQEFTEDTLFVLSRRENSLGTVVTVECIGPISLERKFVYEVVAADGVVFAKLRALAETRAVWLGGEQPGNSYLLVPKDFVGDDGKLNLEVTIKRDRGRRSARARK